MKIEFTLEEKTFKSEDGKEIKYYVLKRKLIDGSEIVVPLKGEKSKLLLMSLAIEKTKKEN